MVKACLIWYIDSTITKWPRAPWDSLSANIGKQKCNSDLSLSFPGDAVLISQHSRSGCCYFSSKIKLGGHSSERQTAQWGWAMVALLSDVKISSRTPLRWLLKYDEQMGVRKKGEEKGMKTVLSEGEIVTVSSAGVADTFKPRQDHWACIWRAMAVLTVEPTAHRLGTLYGGFMNNACT